MRNGITKRRWGKTILNVLQCWHLIPPAIKGEPVYTCKAGQAGTLPQLDPAGSCEHLPPVFKTQSHLHAFLPSPICKALMIAQNGLSHLNFTVFLSLRKTTCSFNFRWSIMIICLNVMRNLSQIGYSWFICPKPKVIQYCIRHQNILSKLREEYKQYHDWEVDFDPSY